MFAWSLVGIKLEVLTSRDKLKLGNKSLEVYQMLVQHVARDNSGLSLARRKDATCFLRWIMSVMTNSTVQACHQKAMGSKTMERIVSTVILNVCQSTGIEKEDESRQSLENHGKFDEVRRMHNKKFEENPQVRTAGSNVASFTQTVEEDRATLTSWLYIATKDHMKKYQKEYRQFQAEIGPEAIKRPLLTYRNAITTGWKRVGKVFRDITKARESILEEDLAKNVSLSLYISVCLNRELKMKDLPNQATRLQEQKEWMRSFEQLRA